MMERSELTEKEGKELLEEARQTISRVFFGKKEEERGKNVVSPKLSLRGGTFVTLTLNDRLRGCIGCITSQESIIEGVRKNAIQAAFHDPRFRPLSRDEFEHVRVEVSVLTEPHPLPYADADDLKVKLRPGRDGVIIKKGHLQATFLPQVWEQLPDTESFLTHLCIKAGLREDAWMYEKLQVSTYEVQAFEEE
ncbi:MAG: AmmeMemoRadiSam system protein A [Deltaproteobacteria bacterium]|nr:AmmeMemoRadiSam system protein A [Deltaproteobacteria bacterium]